MWKKELSVERVLLVVVRSWASRSLWEPEQWASDYWGGLEPQKLVAG